MKIVLLGAPGCGKGTQASRISEKYNVPHISTGDIFRENIKNQTPLGIKVRAIMDSGKLCPDDVTCDIIKDRLSREDCKNGYLLDGFPRNLFQAEALDVFAKPSVVLDISVDFDKIEKRITGRRSCPRCGASFHVDFIGDQENCLECGAKLIVRKDDTPEVIRERLSVYKSYTEPLINFYNKQGILRSINGDKSIDEVFDEIVKVLN